MLPPIASTFGSRRLAPCARNREGLSVPKRDKEGRKMAAKKSTRKATRKKEARRWWLRGQGCREWWASGRTMFGDGFVAFVESEIAEIDAAGRSA